MLADCVSSTSPTEASEVSSPKAAYSPKPMFDQDDMSTVLFLDWDDTLLASSYLNAHGYRLDTTAPLTSEMEAQMKSLEQSVIALLSLAIENGQTCIITNAETGWVQLSAKKFMPNVVPLLSKVRIVSARSEFEQKFPQAPQQWKTQAFLENIRDCFPSSTVCRQVISFGDSNVEREAVHAATKDLENCRTKSVKFVERPSISQLEKQLNLVMSCFSGILKHDGHLDLMLTISVLS